MMLLRWVTPSRSVAAVTDIDAATLAASGIRGVIVDLDNTIVAWNVPAPDAAVAEWIGRLRAAGVRACIVSNNLAGRPRTIAAALGIPIVVGAIKPTPWALRRAMALMGTTPATTALVGDQLFTDILGGNLLGLHTILVTPLSRNEFFTTKIVRALERTIRSKALQASKRASEQTGNPDKSL